jgi:hypothetical protein
MEPCGAGMGWSGGKGFPSQGSRVRSPSSAPRLAGVFRRPGRLGAPPARPVSALCQRRSRTGAAARAPRRAAPWRTIARNASSRSRGVAGQAGGLDRIDDAAAASERAERAAQVVRAHLAEPCRLACRGNGARGVPLPNRKAGAGDEHEAAVSPAASPLLPVEELDEHALDRGYQRDDPRRAGGGDEDLVDQSRVGFSMPGFC